MRFSSVAILLAAAFVWATPLFCLAQSSNKVSPLTLDPPSWSPSRSGDQPTGQLASQINQGRLIVPADELSGDPFLSIVFNETQLEEAIEQLKIETGLDIRLGDESLAQRALNIRIKRQRIEQALQTIASQVDAYVEYDSAKSVYFLYAGEREKEPPPKAPEGPDHKVLEGQINEAFPDSFVQLSKIGDQLLVRGQAKDFIEANQILKLIAAFMPEESQNDQAASQTNQLINSTNGLQSGFDALAGQLNSFSTRDRTSRVINLLTVPGSQQVMLRVTVAEVNRSAARSIGLNFLVRNGEDNLFRSAFGPAGDGDSFFGDTLSGGTIQALIDSSDVGLAIDALRDLSLAKTLSEPNLTTIHGQRAEFRAGGRFPVPVISGLNNAGTQGVQFVPFGVSLDFTPFIIERDRIRLVMQAEVSSLNGEIGSSIGGEGGTPVTGLDSREFSTCLLYTSPSPRDRTRSRMPSSA